MHVCPQLRNFPLRRRLIAESRLAVSSIITGHFPPNYKMQGTKFLAASIATNRPVKVEPVKHITSTGSLVTALATSILPSITW